MHYTLDYTPILPSTNTRAMELARAGAPSHTLVVADYQTQGRGRRGRTWHSPQGGAWFSLLLRPQIPPTQGLTLLAALAAREACETVAGIKSGIKWPNDIMWQGKKLGGILLELAIEGNILNWAVLGVGININQQAFPPELRETAISLQQTTPDAVIQAFCDAFDKRWPAFLSEGIPGLMPEYIAYSVTLGRRVEIITDQRLEGVAERLGPQGELLLRLDTGELQSIWAGDVSCRYTKDQ